eukprot:865223_1
MALNAMMSSKGYKTLVLFRILLMVVLPQTNAEFPIGCKHNPTYDCKTAFKYFVEHKPNIKGAQHFGIEYFHKSFRHNQAEWFVNKHKLTAANTMFRCCQTFIEEAKLQYFTDHNRYRQLIYNNPFQLKIRQATATVYYLYIKNIHKSTDNWFDIAKYHYDDASPSNSSFQILISTSSSIRPSLRRSTSLLHRASDATSSSNADKHTNETLRFEDDTKTHDTNDYSDDVPVLRTLKQYGIISANDTRNTFYFRIPSQRNVNTNIPSQAMKFALNKGFESIHRDTSVVYHAIMDPNHLLSILIRDNISFSDFSQNISVTSNYLILEMCCSEYLAHHYDKNVNTIVTAKHRFYYSLILELRVNKSQRIEYTEATTTCTMFKDSYDNGIYNELYSMKDVHIEGLVVKRHKRPKKTTQVISDRSQFP